MADFLLAGTNDNFMFLLCCCIVIGVTLAVFNISRSVQLETTQMPQNRVSRNSSHHDDCAICLNTHVLAVETNCGHKFCGTCIKNYLNRSSWDLSLIAGRVSCPLCRQDINILLLCFLPDEMVSTELEEERMSVERIVSEYNLRFGRGPRNITSYVRDCPVLIRHMFYDFFTFGGLLWMFKLRVILCCVGALAYFCNPLDIIPEAIFGVFGFLDDVIIFLLCVIYVSIIYRRVVINRATNST